jgi:hypothetical protein
MLFRPVLKGKGENCRRHRRNEEMRGEMIEDKGNGGWDCGFSLSIPASQTDFLCLPQYNLPVLLFEGFPPALRGAKLLYVKGVWSALIGKGEHFLV